MKWQSHEPATGPPTRAGRGGDMSGLGRWRRTAGAGARPALPGRAAGGTTASRRGRAAFWGRRDAGRQDAGAPGVSRAVRRPSSLVQLRPALQFKKIMNLAPESRWIPAHSNQFQSFPIKKTMRTGNPAKRQATKEDCPSAATHFNFSPDTVSWKRGEQTITVAATGESI